ncbi:helix-turn-helix domain-containing protein [Levilactobacillus sp. N40-8-2]|mgnify:FL=1|uniref:helix-turn-helix domain-containing protein n=1 Tax=Levilactobacillus muriae TaxID=3238987 RepID=UPI0038B2F171
MSKKTFYNAETETTEQYTEIWKLELVKVREEEDLLVRNHYWRDSDNELWVDFDCPMENTYRAFKAYRVVKGYMRPDEIRKLREDLHMSVRKFADTLGIASSSLTQIENNQRVQAKYQENLFEAARDNYEKNGRLPDGWASNIEDGLANVLYETDIRDFVYESFESHRIEVKSFNKNSKLGDVA